MKSVVAQIWPKVAAGEGVQLFKSHRPDYADGGQMRDFVYVRDCVEGRELAARHAGRERDLQPGLGQGAVVPGPGRAVFTAAGRAPQVAYVDTPVEIRDKYQYFTQADMTRLKAAGYAQAFTELEAGVADYVARYLSQEDPYR